VSTLYKICGEAAWLEAKRLGVLSPSPADARDGFIHLSASHQVVATAAKHFARQARLMLLSVPRAALPEECLRWEVSRDGDRFPHFYGELKTDYVSRAVPLPLDENGVHVFPDLVSRDETSDP
jgi:uncharacterized protein (DUF952 family)